ncbi:hypothetical protein FQN54_004134 [Arachnomyces sp. PD_36]|nr:hypothetical protein FQN54_004134 [Arachnomyces sp. PD_36]
MWFGPEFIGQEVTFSKPNPSTWVLKEQISEHADSYNQEDCEELDLIPEARAVFTCSRRDGEGPEEAIIKILMQIPWEGTEGKSAKKRAAQAGSSESLEFEAGALDILTDANSSSTPIILAAKEAKQTKNMWVPGGVSWFHSYDQAARR